MKNTYKIIIIILIIITAILFIYQVNNSLKISIKRKNLPLISTVAINIPLDKNDPIFGNQGAPITITAFFDLNNKDSKKTISKLTTFIYDHPTEIRMVYKIFPYSRIFASDNNLTHKASWCVLQQDGAKFWNYLDILGKSTENIKKIKILTKLTTSLDIDKVKLSNCIDSDESKIFIEESISLAKSLYIKKSPTIFVNNKKINYLDEIELTDLLEELIKNY